MCLSKKKNKAWFKFLYVARPCTELLLNHFLLFILFCWGRTEVSFILRWRSHCYLLFLNVPLSRIFPRDFSSRRIERRASFRSNSHLGDHSLWGKVSPQAVISTELWEYTNTGLHTCRFPGCQWGKGLPAASSDSICLPASLGRCAVTLFSAPSLRRKLCLSRQMSCQS